MMALAISWFVRIFQIWFFFKAFFWPRHWTSYLDKIKRLKRTMIGFVDEKLAPWKFGAEFPAEVWIWEICTPGHGESKLSVFFEAFVWHLKFLWFPCFITFLFPPHFWFVLAKEAVHFSRGGIYWWVSHVFGSFFCLEWKQFTRCLFPWSCRIAVVCKMMTFITMIAMFPTFFHIPTFQSSIWFDALEDKLCSANVTTLFIWMQ